MSEIERLAKEDVDDHDQDQEHGALKDLQHVSSN